MLSYWYNNSHYNHKTVWWPSYLYYGNLIPGKTVFVMRWGPASKTSCRSMNRGYEVLRDVKFSLTWQLLKWSLIMRRCVEDGKKVLQSLLGMSKRDLFIYFLTQNITQDQAFSSVEIWYQKPHLESSPCVAKQLPEANVFCLWWMHASYP